MRVLLTGGGTAGHINPALAIANHVRQKQPFAEILFVGTRYGLEKNLVPREGYDIKFVDVMGLRRSLTLENLKVLKKFITSRREAAKILDAFRPDIVIGTGGYVCVPTVSEAVKRRIPTIIHEQNVHPGLAIKMLAPKADVTALSFAETEKYVKAKRALLTGNPLRPGIFSGMTSEELHREMGFLDEPVVLLFGGSLGAERINDALFEMLCAGVSGYNLIAATGESHYKDMLARLHEAKVNVKAMQNVSLVPYIYNMERIIGAADLIVSRAGAITLGEINALGKCAILIPSPNVVHDHQVKNARYLENKGAAAVLTEENLTGKFLNAKITKLLKSKSDLAAMSEHSRKMGIRDACEKIYALALELTGA